MRGVSVEQLVTDVERGASEPLVRLGAAVSAADELRVLGDDLVGRFVDDARAAGRSWAEIGRVLGVSKQAAQQRFPAASAEAWPPGFREDAQRALASAGAHARRLGQPCLGGEHVLLALAEQDDSLAGQVLGDLDVTPVAVEHAIDAIAVRGEPSRGPIGVSARVKRALEQTRREGRRLGHGRCPGAEHLLLALRADQDGAAARILRDLDVTPERLHDRLAARLGPEAAEFAAQLQRPRSRLRRRH
jgi:Clp amino terminal domain, pathogenicity island component